MTFLVKSNSRNKIYGPYDTFAEAQKQADMVDSILRRNNLTPDARVVPTDPSPSPARAERGKQDSKRIPYSPGRKRQRKKPGVRKYGRKRGGK